MDPIIDTEYEVNIEHPIWRALHGMDECLEAMGFSKQDQAFCRWLMFCQNGKLPPAKDRLSWRLLKLTSGYTRRTYKAPLERFYQEFPEMRLLNQNMASN